MAFFDNWRVQLASINSLDNESERRVQGLQNEYCIASANRQQAIFEEYRSSVDKIQVQLTPFLSTGALFSAMWEKSCELYPELKAIKDNNVRHAILACSTKEAQDTLLRKYLTSGHSQS